MPRYKVTVQEKVTKEIEVDAETCDQAEEEAQEQFHTTYDKNALVELDVIDVEKECAPGEGLREFVESFLNGNLRETRRAFGTGAFNGEEVREALRDLYGFSDNKAAKAVGWMRGEVKFQAYCDAI